MIHVENLTKYYDDYPAVRDVSFDVARGQIVGFLGPNGAGKTTTMRVLAGYLTATSGKAMIDGIDVFVDPLGVRRRIGYLPENCPLYTDMRVKEYLHFRAGIKGIHGPRRKRQMEYVVERCWLGEVERQLIGTLSKGFRQRVGLADSLLADPPVLILDEPTAGLDPKQIRSTRTLIRELGQEHTILLSTHILPEVEMTCDYVIIIDKGRKAASGSLDQLSLRAEEKECVTLRVAGDAGTEAVKSLEGAADVYAQPVGQDTELRVTTGKGDVLAPQLISLATEQGWKILEMRRDRQTLEDMFVRITSGDGEYEPPKVVAVTPVPPARSPLDDEITQRIEPEE